MRTIPAATLRPSTPPPLPVNPPEIAEAEIIVDLQVKEMSTILEPPATPRPPITLLPVTSHGTAVPEIIVDEETWTIPEPPATPTSSTPPSPLPVTPPRSASSQFANRRKSSRTTRPILKLNISTTLKSTSARKKTRKTRRLHRCPICRKAFSFKSTLTRHRFIHLSQEEKTVAKQTWRIGCFFCPARFPNQSAYDRHLVTHTGEKFFRCDQCGKQCSQSGQLTVHKRTHSANPRPFWCAECDKTFALKAALLIHKKAVHEKLKDVECPRCPRRSAPKGT
ncbi:zinc finger protein 479 [Folsomia candida]|uniref:zinc finger protein 479 n=1 Tax=Folsomia candida TaxID=158441 RepID=UPI00160538AA|nr:zinc finger protein 479 [Folsomia candida]